MGGPGLRFVLEAGFLIALAVAAGFAELSPTTIVLVMGAAWLLVAVIEWLAWRESPRTIRVVREQAVPAAVQAPPSFLASPSFGARARAGRRGHTGFRAAAGAGADAGHRRRPERPVSARERG